MADIIDRNYFSETKNSPSNLVKVTIDDRGQNAVYVGSTGAALVRMRENTTTVVQGTGGIFSSKPRERSKSYKYTELDVDTQKMLLASGVKEFAGTKIPEEPKNSLRTGMKTVSPNIFDDGTFSEVIDGVVSKDSRYIPTARIPDSYTYNFALNMGDRSIPISKKGNTQFAKPAVMFDSSFEEELAKARYLIGMEPYLTQEQATLFDHYTYRKYKTPNSSNAFAGAFIHIFITRPDLNLFMRGMDGMSLRPDVYQNSELASLIDLNPMGATSLVRRWKTGMTTDINLFLSNKATGVTLDNESIDEHNFVEAYNGSKPPFAGRFENTEGDISITFNETQDLAVSNTILLWLKYMHAVYIGEISPLGSPDEIAAKLYTNYTPHQHALWRRLDTHSSIYIIATDMTQRNIIFWRKYFGIFPKGTAHGGLTADGNGKAVEGMRKISIPFRYTTFRTNNLVDLFAFNSLNDIHVLYDSHSGFAGNSYLAPDVNVATEHDQIAGLPFVTFDDYDLRYITEGLKNLRPMHCPQLIFTRSDGALIPDNPDDYQKYWVNKYWGSPSRYSTRA